jgi:chromosome segregation ATPase
LALRDAADAKYLAEKAERAATDAQAAESELQDKMADDRDIYTQLEAEKANAKKHNDLRLSVESNFAALSEQFEELQNEHEGLTSRFGDADRECRMAKGRLATLEDMTGGLEAGLAQAQKERDEANLQVGHKTGLHDREVKDHNYTKGELERVTQAQEDLQDQVDTQRFVEDNLRKELLDVRREASELQHKAANGAELEIKNEHLMAQSAATAKEMSELRLLVTRLQSTIATMDEEETHRKETSVSLKQYQLVKDQLAESQRRVAEVQRAEKGWAKERAKLLDEIAKLKQELRSRQPRKNRIMEMEVQNELLMGMLKSSPKQFNAARRANGKPQQTPPRSLPPLDSPVGNPANGSDHDDDDDAD